MHVLRQATTVTGAALFGVVALVGVLLSVAGTAEAGLKVFDANGKKLGVVIEQSSENAEVLVKHDDGTKFIVDVGNNWIQSEADGQLFESDDCSGTPLIETDEILNPRAFISSDGTVFIRDADAPSQTVLVRSELRAFELENDHNQPEECRIFNAPEDLEVVPWVAIPSLNILEDFTPPFTAR